MVSPARMRSAWTFEAARTGFERHAPEWDALNREHGNHILLDSRFVGALVRRFSTRDTLLAVSGRPGARGLVLVEPGRRGLATTFQPSQSPLGLLLLESADLAVPMSLELLRRLPGPALSLSILQQDPACTLFGAHEAHALVRRVEYIDTGRVPIRETFEEYWQGRGRNLKHNLGRQRRRLAEEGRPLELRVIRDPDRVPECMATYGRLEASGWKAEGGTAVTPDNDQGAFYREILETFLGRDEGYVLQLELDGQVIAADLCLERDGIVVILKTAYDAGVTGLSPGLLLHQEAFQHWFTSGRVRVVEFYGRVLDWHTKWTDDFRRMYHLNLYRGRWAAGLLDLARRAAGLGRSRPARKAAEHGSDAKPVRS